MTTTKKAETAKLFTAMYKNGTVIFTTMYQNDKNVKAIFTTMYRPGKGGRYKYLQPCTHSGQDRKHKRKEMQQETNQSE